MIGLMDYWIILETLIHSSFIPLILFLKSYQSTFAVACKAAVAPAGGLCIMQA